MKNFYDLFVVELQNMYNAEKQILTALPHLIEVASAGDLKEALRHHLKETKEQVSRLELIAEELDEKLVEGKSEGMAGLLKDGAKAGKARYDKAAKDAGIIAALQRVEHYEIAAYGVLKSLAKHLNLTGIEHLLQASSKEEGKANKKLNELAEGSYFSTGINDKACKRCA